MKAEFLMDCELEIVEQVDELNDIVEMTVETIKKGEVVEFDVIDHPERIKDGKIIEDENLVNIQFGDGSMAFSVDKGWFKEIN